MARLARFERATAWFVARYSIQLSYRRVEGRYYREEVVCSQGLVGVEISRAEAKTGCKYGGFVALFDPLEAADSRLKPVPQNAPQSGSTLGCIHQNPGVHHTGGVQHAAGTGEGLTE